MIETMLEATVGLDRTRYKILLVWDSVRNKDVGWLTVPAESRPSLQHPVFQLRDVHLKLEEEQLPSKLVAEIKYQERKEPSFPSEDMSKIQEKSKNSHQQEVNASPSLVKEVKLPNKEMGSKSDGAKVLLENGIQPVLQTMNLHNKVIAAHCKKEKKQYQLAKLCSEMIDTMNGLIKQLSSKVWQCKICHKEFEKLVEARHHTETHKEHRESVHHHLRFHCHCCEYVPSSRRNLQAHKAKMHSDEKMSSHLFPDNMNREETKQYNTRKHLKQVKIKEKVASKEISKYFEQIKCEKRKAPKKNCTWLQWVQEPFPMDLKCSTKAMSGDRFEVKKCSVSMGQSEDIQNVLKEQVEIVNTLRKKGRLLRISKTGDICDICGKKLSSVKSGIHTHKQIFHYMEGINCTICGKINMMTSNYRAHMRKHHS